MHSVTATVRAGRRHVRQEGTELRGGGRVHGKWGVGGGGDGRGGTGNSDVCVAHVTRCDPRGMPRQCRLQGAGVTLLVGL